jgi:hypothetical protein
MRDDEAVIEEVHTDEVRDLVESLRERDDLDASVRLIVRFEGDEYDVAYVREDVDRQYTDAELEARIETLVMKGLGDPPREQSLYDFGSLRATIRWFDGAVCAYFPDDEWSGVIVVLDGVESPVMDVAFEHLVD